MPQVLTREIIIINASAFYQNPPRPQTKISTIYASGRGLTRPALSDTYKELEVKKQHLPFLNFLLCQQSPIYNIGVATSTGPVSKQELQPGQKPRCHKNYLDKTVAVFESGLRHKLSSNRLFVFHMPHITASSFRATA
jgi:hypothetical protein